MKQQSFKQRHKSKIISLAFISMMMLIFLIPSQSVGAIQASFDSQNPSSAVKDSYVTVAFTKCTAETSYIVVITDSAGTTSVDNQTFSTGSGQTTGQITFKATISGLIKLVVYQYNTSTGAATGSSLATGTMQVNEPDNGDIIFNNLTLFVLMFAALIALGWIGSNKYLK